MARIELDDVCLTFHVRQHRRMPLKDYLVRRMFKRSLNPRVEVQALRNVDLRLREGDRLGVIGANGAGKSTLLRTLAGVYPPTGGRSTIEGRVGALFDVAMGFEWDASGWENIAFRGYLQGETPRSIAMKAQAIAEFSELGEHLDRAVRYYSTGMLVRLGFAIATAIEPEILIVDEILSAGDLSFQIKARARMEEMFAAARIVVLASHDLASLARLCDRVAWLDHGRVRQIGRAADVIAAYQQESRAPSRQAA